MATKPLIVKIVLVDQTSQGLDKIQKKVKQVESNFNQFNKSMFAATALMGNFTRAVGGGFEAINKAAKFDRVIDQFERMFGDRSTFLSGVSHLKNVVIDDFEAMRAAIDIKSLGIVQDTESIQNIIGQSALVAKGAGRTAAEGIQHITNFLKEGHIAHLEYLGLMNRSNPAMLAQLNILNKSGKLIGSAITAQYKKEVALTLLAVRAKQLENMELDLADAVQHTTNSFRMFSVQAGTFFGESIKGLILKIGTLTAEFSAFFEKLKNSNPGIKFLTGNLIALSTVLSGIVVTFGTLRLLTVALSSIGIGGFGALAKVAALATAGFLAFRNSTGSIIDGLETFGSVIKGVFDLVSTALEPENFEKGIGKIDKKLKEFLEGKGLFGTVVGISKILLVITAYVRDVINRISSFFGVMIDGAKGALGLVADLIEKIAEVTGFDKDLIPRSFIESLGWVRETLVNIGALFGIFGIGAAGIMAIKSATGSLFGGKRGDSPTNPIYVVDVGSGLGAAKKAITSIPGMAALGGIFAGLGIIFSLLKQSLQLGGLKQVIKDIPTAIALAFPRITALFARLITMAGSVITAAISNPVVWGGAAVVLSAGIGAAIGTAINKLIEGTAIEQGIQGMMSKVSGFFGGPTIMSDEEAFAQAERNQLARTGKVSQETMESVYPAIPVIRPQTFTPKVSPVAKVGPTSEMAPEIDLDYLTEAYSSLEENKKGLFSAAMMEAQAATSAGGEAITSEEYVVLLETLVKLNAEIARNTKRTESAESRSVVKKPVSR